MSGQYDEKRYFEITEPKPVYSRFFATLDIRNWLGSETIQSVNFTAKERTTDEDDVSDVVLDPDKNTYDAGGYLKPYVRAGVENTRYRITITVQTIESSYEIFYIDFRIKSG